MLTRAEMSSAFAKWGAAWNEHDLDGVMDLFHDEIYFENWNGGSVTGKENLREAWAPWFANHGDFKFTTEETFIDEVDQKMLFRWQL
ncbi:MAG: nuclear transport factor 2 family protein, partial [bacterium]|nr:nuclear transport factor 2 family protein [bacterium]